MANLHPASATSARYYLEGIYMQLDSSEEGNIAAAAAALAELEEKHPAWYAYLKEWCAAAPPYSWRAAVLAKLDKGRT